MLNKDKLTLEEIDKLYQHSGNLFELVKEIRNFRDITDLAEWKDAYNYLVTEAETLIAKIEDPS